MPRQARIVIPNEAHHVTQRGNYQMAIFDREKDYHKYIGLINKYKKEYKIKVLAYCLMTNHVHFIVIPKTADSLGKFFNTVHMRYSHYLNRLRKKKGHLWQGRFYSCVMDERHVYCGVRYVERNPVRAKMVKRAWEYSWSSAGTHVGNAPLIGIGLDESIGNMSEIEWKICLEEFNEKEDEEIRKKTQQGLVVAEDVFIKKMEKRLKRSLAYRVLGRPKKQ